MKRLFCCGCMLLLLLPFIFLSIGANAQGDTSWNKKKAEAWFKKAVWLHARTVQQPVLHYDTFGRVLDDDAADSNETKTAVNSTIELKPHSSINKEAFARQYNKDKTWWDEAFAYLKETDLTALKPGKFSIDGDNVMVTVTEGTPRLMDTTKWESHLLYSDIHYVISGKEKIGITAISSVTVAGAYNPVRDLIYYTGKGKYYLAEPGTFYVFFPQDAHRPNLQAENYTDKKIVIKVKSSGQ
ncbi:MAG TPA: YhcH/YjgK/YiaL family protein [Chitinophagaceae bacterium]|nr:YhcH/YjgK/YiaL family protein [Chitinophagaceae bacterium]